MRRLITSALAALLAAAAPALGLDRLLREHGDFESPQALAAFELQGEVERVELAAPLGHGARFGEESGLWTSVQIPPAPAPEKLAAEGWFLVASVRVHWTGAPESNVGLWLASADGRRELAATSRTIVWENQRELSTCVRLAFVPGGALAEEAVRVGVRGGGLLLDDLCLERFHAAPTRALVGKANGHLGPDLLACAPLGFTGLTEHLHTSFSVLDVRADGPAARAGLEVGDVVVALDRDLQVSSIAPGWDWFERSHEALLGRGLLELAGSVRESVPLTVLRDGEERTLLLRQPFGERSPFAARLDDGFPLRGAYADALRRDLTDWALSHQRDDGGFPGTDAVNPALGGLGLLGTRNREYTERIDRTVRYLLEKTPKPSEMRGLAYWQMAFQGMFFCEYHLAGGSLDVLPWIEEAIAWLPGTTHESKWGMQAFGHGPDGLPYDEKALMAPAAHLLVFDALARKCGVESKVWEHIRPYVVHSWSDPEQGGHGGMGYNGSYKDRQEFWSRSGLVALAATLRGEEGPMRRPLCDIMRERHPWMLNSHAYGEPGAALGLLGLAVAHREAFDEVLPQWRWRFLCNWEPGYGLRYSTPHMGAPYMGAESVVNLAYLVLLSVENGGLVMSGGAPARWLAD